MEEIEVIDFNLVEVRLIQSLWEKKTVQYIANMLDRPISAVRRKIEEMNQAQKVELYQLPQFSRKLKKKEAEWAIRQLQEQPKMKIADQTGKRSVRIDGKTIVLVKPGTDVEKYKSEYLKRKLSAVNNKGDE